MQSYDGTTHFESTVTDVLNMYTMITGKVTLETLFTDLLLCAAYDFLLFLHGN